MFNYRKIHRVCKRDRIEVAAVPAGESGFGWVVGGG